MDKICPQCGNNMVQRRSAKGAFWGCKGYPTCKHTENINTPAPTAGAYQPTLDKDKIFFETLEKILEQQSLIAVQLERIENLTKSIETFVIGSETPEYEGAPVKKN